MLSRPFGWTVLLALLGMASGAYGSSRNEIKLLAISGNQQVNPFLDGSIFAVDLTSAKPQLIRKLTQIPGGNGLGWNPVDGLLYHTSGDSSWSNDIASDGRSEEHTSELQSH